MDNKEDILNVIRNVIGLSDEWEDGTYLHWLTRCKSAFSVGTVTIDDFEEINDDLTYEIYEAIKPFLKESN